MKLSIVFTILGAFGVAQYVYWQFTPLALSYSYRVVPAEEYGQFGLKTIETTVTRDWTVGVVGLLIGLVLLSIGVYKLVKSRKHYARKFA
jgi:hypothetical protein